MNVWSIYCKLPADLVGSKILSMVGLVDLVQLEVAGCSKSFRQELVKITKFKDPVAIDKDQRWSFAIARWLVRRDMRVTRLVLHESDEELFKDMLCTCPHMIDTVDVRRYFSEITDVLGIVGERLMDKVVCWHQQSDCVLTGINLLRNLTSLCVHYGDTVAASETDWVAEALLHCPQLSSLEVDIRAPLAQFFYHAMATAGHKLQHLKLASPLTNEHMEDANLARIIKGCPNLRTIAVRGSSWWSSRLVLSDSITAVALHCPQLRSLSLSQATPAEASIAKVVQNCPKLRTVHLPDVVITDNMLLALSSGRCHLTGASFSPIRNLTAVWAVGCVATIKQCAPMLSMLRNTTLAALPAGDSSMDVKVATLAEALGRMESIEVLDLKVDSHWEALRALADNCPNLRELTCSTVIPAVDMMPLYELLLRGCPKLEVLRVRDMLKDSVFRPLPSLTPGSGYPEDNRCRALRVLDCLAPALTDDGITALAQCATTSLEEVHLWTATKLTDRSLAALAQHCPFLKVVRIVGGDGEISGRGLRRLCDACKHLDRVELTGCLISRTEIAALVARAQARRKKLQIVISVSHECCKLF